MSNKLGPKGPIIGAGALFDASAPNYFAMQKLLNIFQFLLSTSNLKIVNYICIVKI